MLKVYFKIIHSAKNAGLLRPGAFLFRKIFISQNFNYLSQDFITI